jgi:general secretion pathway protein K
VQSTRACKEQKASARPETRDQSGIAIFMVLAAMSVLTILVSEFAYVAQVNARMAFDSADQIKAHYLAKSGVKLSLLRLKAYAQLKAATGGTAGGSNPLAGAVPKGVLEKIWNFPFMYPLPQIPGMSISQKDQLDEFQKSSGLDGKFTAVIESEDAKYNLNMILAAFAGAQPSPSPSVSQSPGANPSPSPSSSFDPQKARDSLRDYIQQIITNKIQDDEDFAHEYRDFKVDDLVTGISMWGDRTYNLDASIPSDQIPPKRAPFYSLTELHMIPPMDDQLYDLLIPGMTVNATPGININAMQEQTLRALVPQMTTDEVADFFKYRDDPTVDNLFTKISDFTDWVTKNVGAFRGDASAVAKWQSDLQARGIHLVLDQTDFKITVQAQVNQALRTFEVWVSLTPASNAPAPKPSASPAPAPVPGAQPSNSVPDAGLKITFMRIL